MYVQKPNKFHLPLGQSSSAANGHWPGPDSLTPLVLCGKGLEVAGVLQSLHLIADATVQEANEVEAVQLELQSAVQV